MGDKQSPGKRVEVRVRKNGKKEKAMYERVEAEGLPSGWIKDIRVKKVGNKVRKDPFYTDPKSGYVFRSLKDSLRYIETGEIGRLAFKPKDKNGHEDDDLEDDEDDSPPAAVKEQKVEETGTEAKITNQSTKMNEITKDEDVLNSACKGEGRSISEVTSDQDATGNGNAHSCSIVEEAKRSEQMDNQKDSVGNDLLSTPKQSPECGEKKTEETSKTKPKRSRGKRKKEVLDLPRRSSQRLAARALDQTKQQEDNNDVLENRIEAEGPPDLTKSKNPENNLTESKNENTKQEESLLDLPMDDLLSDPCIAFAIKTLKGEFETPNASEVSSLGSNKEIEGNIKQENIAIAENSSKPGEKPEPPLELPSENIWQDPCIEFAIKTLTGAIDPDIENCLKQPESNSSQIQAKTEFSCQQYDTMEKPGLRKSDGSSGS